MSFLPNNNIGGKGLVGIEDWLSIEIASIRKCKRKARHSEFFTDIEPMMDEKSCTCIQRDNYMKKDMKGMLISAHDLQSLQKRYTRKTVDGEDI